MPLVQVCCCTRMVSQTARSLLNIAAFSSRPNTTPVSMFTLFFRTARFPPGDPVADYIRRFRLRDIKTPSLRWEPQHVRQPLRLVAMATFRARWIGRRDGRTYSRTFSFYRPQFHIGPIGITRCLVVPCFFCTGEERACGMTAKNRTAQVRLKPIRISCFILMYAALSSKLAVYP